MINPNSIRKISIGANVKQQFHYIVGSNFPIIKNNKKIDRVISNIEQSEKYYLIYTKIDDEIQLWKEIPKNEITTHEYEVD